MYPARLICLPEHGDVLEGRVKLNLGAEMLEASVSYTPGEYAEHIAAKILERTGRE